MGEAPETLLLRVETAGSFNETSSGDGTRGAPPTTSSLSLRIPPEPGLLRPGGADPSLLVTQTGVHNLYIHITYM